MMQDQFLVIDAHARQFLEESRIDRRRESAGAKTDDALECIEIDRELPVERQRQLLERRLRSFVEGIATN
jgi:hypothetical protein